MFGFLLAALTLYLVHDIFYVEKSSPSCHEDPPETDAVKIRKLYNQIYKIENRKYTPNTNHRTLRIISSSVLKTAKTIFHYKMIRLHNIVYGHKKLGTKFYVMPYFHSGQWNKALIPIKSSQCSRSLIISIFGIPDTEQDTTHFKWYQRLWKCFQCSNKIVPLQSIDITSELLPYLGPKEDFHGQEVTPHLFGYREITFNFLRSNGITSVTYGKNDVMLQGTLLQETNNSFFL